jgi:hypothetical protein
MPDFKQSFVRSHDSKAYGIEDALRESHRYSEAIRQRDRKDQRQGWLWFSVAVLVAGLLAGFCAWIRQ